MVLEEDSFDFRNVTSFSAFSISGILAWINFAVFFSRILK